jgi:hypothetical protein
MMCSMSSSDASREFKLRLNARHFSDDELLDDLRRVAAALDPRTVTQRSYLKVGMFSCKPYINRFGSWNRAIENAGLPKSRQTEVSDAMLFDNLETMWRSLGRQPFYSEIERPLSRYSVKLYLNRFGGWTKACQAFLIFKRSDADFEKLYRPTARARSRTLNDKLRLKVFKRDNYACVLCGRSPSADVGTSLHVDHIVPFSKGGDHSHDNLRTLCNRCNLARGNDQTV